MKKIFKEIGWNEIYPETTNRIQYFIDEFRKCYTFDEISNKKLTECVVNNFGIYGQGMVYEIYSIVNNSCSSRETLSDLFKQFCIAFEEAGGFESLKPNNYISLFMEYVYSRRIKGFDRL